MITSVTSCFVSTHVVRVPYSSQELAIETAAGTTCMDCGTHTTKQWFDCKDESGNKMCQHCFSKNRLVVAAAAGLRGEGADSERARFEEEEEVRKLRASQGTVLRYNP